MNVNFWNSFFQWGSVVLVALTVFFGAGALIAGNILAKRQEGEISQAAERIATLEIEAGKQRERAAAAEKALAEVQERLRPRELIGEQIKRIRESVAAFGGTPYQLVVNPDPESLRLIMFMDRILRSAKWTPVSGEEGGVSSELESGSLAENEVFAGIAVTFAHGMNDRSKQAAQALAYALKREGLKASLEAHAEGKSDSQNVHIRIGSKE